MKAYKQTIGNTNIYSLPKQDETLYYKYVENTWVQPTISSDGTLGGNRFACKASSVNSSDNPYKAFDSNNETQFTLNANTGTMTIYNPVAIKISSVSIRNGYQSSWVRAITSGTIYGSNDNASWTQLKTFTNSNKTVSAVWSIDMSTNSNYYKYYRFDIKGDGEYARITGMTITATQKDVVAGTAEDYDYKEVTSKYYAIK